MGLTGWIPDHGVHRNITSSAVLVGMVRIALVPEGRLPLCREIIMQIDGQLNTIADLTSSQYVLLALERLRANQFLTCLNVHSIMSEASRFASANWQPAYRNVQPRPIIVSK